MRIKLLLLITVVSLLAIPALAAVGDFSVEINDSTTLMCSKMSGNLYICSLGVQPPTGLVDAMTELTTWWL